MTFVVGFHCFDGLVLCADSEENDGINKKYVDKLYGLEVSAERQLCFGGAGSATAIDKFHSKLSDILAWNDFDEIKTELHVESVLDHMAKSYPHLGFDILLAQIETEKEQTLLYRTYQGEASLRPIEMGSFACVGMDTSLAQFLLGNLFDSFTQIEEALQLGIWVTNMSKIHAHGVSGPSAAFSYRRGDKDGWKRHYTPEISSIEDKYPLEEIRQMLHGYWVRKNPNIYKILGGLPVRGTPNK